MRNRRFEAETSAQKLLAENRITSLFVNIEAQRWEAVVVDDVVYQVEISGDPKNIQKRCTCGFFYDAGYCMHTLAVEKYILKKGFSPVISLNARATMPVRTKFDPSTLFLTAIKKIQPPKESAPAGTQGKPLKIEFHLNNTKTSTYDEGSDLLALRLKIGYLEDFRTSYVENIHQFLHAFAEGKTYKQKNKTFLLTGQVVDEATADCLSELHQFSLQEDFYFLRSQVLQHNRNSSELILPPYSLENVINRIQEKSGLTTKIDGKTLEEVHFEAEDFPFSIKVTSSENGVNILLPEDLGKMFAWYQKVLVGNVFYSLKEEQVDAIEKFRKVEERIHSHVIPLPIDSAKKFLSEDFF
ncbi:MAG: SNF2 helicase associated domain-containing protein, partial [Streptococcaceae bacterium]|nr:SNF2 helicase associated domain-containing protein [Streptococcaceae bacterium]